MTKTARADRAIIIPDSSIFTESVVRGLQEKKGKDIIIIDLRKIPTAIADYFVVCHGDSAPQTEALARSVEEIVFKETGEWPDHIEGLQNAKWVLIDYIHVIVHIFQPEQRDYYGIERLWADAPVKRITDNY